MVITTLCYLEKDGCYLMLHRVRKQEDYNAGKWIGVGGKLEEGESPDDCVRRETLEETGLSITGMRFRGIVTFVSETDGKLFTEQMCLYTCSSFTGTLTDCSEGELAWIPRSSVMRLNLWEGDRIFLRLLDLETPFFVLKLFYRDNILKEAVLDGRKLELLDILDSEGNRTGEVRERQIAHEDGSLHPTAHIWIARKGEAGWEILLQKRSSTKESFPGCLDVSAAGHVGAGEEYLTSAVRELKEELGIDALPGELAFAGYYEGEWHGSFGGRPFHNHEISANYLLVRDPAPEEFVLQPEEVSSVQWMPLKQLQKELKTGSQVFCIVPEELELIAQFLSDPQAPGSREQPGR